MTRKLPFLCLLTLLATPAIWAGSVTYDSTTIPMTATDWATGGLPLIFRQWDPALFPGQHLVGVQFTLFGAGEGKIRLYNNGTASANLQGTNTVTVTLRDFAGIPIVVTLPTFTTGVKTVAAGETTVFGGSNTYSSTPPYEGVVPYHSEDEETSPLYTWDIMDLSPFQGSGDFDGWSVTANNTWTATGGGDNTGGGTVDTKASAYATVTYSYTSDVPEPAMLTLVGGGLLGIGFVGRRRKKA